MSPDLSIFVLQYSLQQPGILGLGSSLQVVVSLYDKEKVCLSQGDILFRVMRHSRFCRKHANKEKSCAECQQHSKAGKQ